MKRLIEIAKIVTKKKVVKLEVLDEYVLKRQSKINEFFEGVTGNKFKNDRDAAFFLYGSTPQDPKYRKLKSRFRQRLLNTIFLIEPNKPISSNYDKTYYNCYKEWAQIKILRSNNALNTAASLTKHLFTIAQKYELLDIALNCIKDLREHAIRQNNEKDFDKYGKLEEVYEEMVTVESRAKNLYQKARMIAQKNIPNAEKNLHELIDIAEKLVLLSEKHDIPSIFYYMFSTWLIRYELEGDYEAILEVCVQAEEYILNNGDFFPSKTIYLFYIKKTAAFLHLQDYTQGKKQAEAYIQKIPAKRTEWFDFMEFYLLLSIHSRNYLQAFAIFNNITSNPTLKKLDSKTKEKWNLFNAWLYYIIQLKNFDKILIKQVQSGTFDIETYLHKKTDYPLALRHIDVLRKVLQAHFFIFHKKYTEADEIILTLNYYANHKLDKTLYYRCIQFIKLLNILKKAEYQMDEIRNADKYYSRLREHPFNYRSNLAGLEIIPYEMLWEMLN